MRSRALLCLVVSLGACGRSVLIERSDSTFTRAAARYEQTRRRLAASDAPEEDRSLFLLAEGLFRYRFSPPARSTGAYLAEGAASIIDLPVLASFAGSLDLFSLRLRTYDGAAQIWETLLDRDPTSPLRPLVLYRLGWAYRNVIASGFPRDSHDAFAAAARDYPDSAVGKLSREALEVPSKSPGTATAWSLVPGLGQIYAGEYGNGAVRVGVALAAAALFVVPTVIAYQRRHDLSWSRDWPLLAAGVGGAIVLTIDYSLSYDDALRAVLQFNERREGEFEEAHPEAP